jgi:hypothetical protein
MHLPTCILFGVFMINLLSNRVNFELRIVFYCCMESLPWITLRNTDLNRQSHLYPAGLRGPLPLLAGPAANGYGAVAADFPLKSLNLTALSQILNQSRTRIYLFMCLHF